MRNLSTFLFFIGFIPAAAKAAVDSSLTVDTGLEYHTNIDQTADNELSDTDRQLGAAIAVSHQSNISNTRLAYRLNKHNFLQDRQEDRTSAEGSARINVEVLKNRLTWFASNLLSEDLTDSRSPDTLDNRERRSTTATGLNLVTRLSARDYVTIAPSISKVSFKDSTGSDSDRRNASIVWTHRLSFVSNLNLTLQGSNVEFDDSDSNYDYSAVNLGLTTRLSRIDYAVAVGGNKVNPETRESIDGLTLNASVNSSPSPNAPPTWGLSVISEITDSSIGFSNFEYEITDFNSDDSNFDTVDILKRTLFQAFVRYGLSERASLLLKSTVNEERYETRQNDQFETGFSAAYSYRYSQKLTIKPAISWRETEFRDDPLEEKQAETKTTLEFTYDFQNAITTRLVLGNTKRDSSEYPNEEFTDQFAILNVAYQVW